VIAHPGADAIARGEEWLQTNTLDGQKAHDSFMKVGGPAYFQEFGPAGYHVSIGFANPKIINGRLAELCASLTTTANPTPCSNKIHGTVTDMRVSRTPDQRLYSSGDHSALGFTQCYISFGDPDDDDVAFTKCNADGTFDFSGLPDGNWRITIFDQWNDQIVDGLSTPVALGPAHRDVAMEIPVQQWHTNIYTASYFDNNGNGVRDADEPGLSLVPTNIRFRDGSYSNFNNTDLAGNAGFNEIFPLFNWYIVETDTARYKQTGVHVVYDAGGPADNNGGGPGGVGSSIVGNLANSNETNHLPSDLHFPGSIYCADADCASASIATGTGNTNSPSTGRIDPPWVITEAWQGFIGQAEYLEFGKAPFAAGENGGIHGEVIYASTRPFDDPALLIPAMAYVTEHLGFAFTSSVLQTPPFTFARQLSTLDHLTRGRVAWNIVTSYLPNASASLGYGGLPPHEARYDRADEYLDVTYKLQNVADEKIVWDLFKSKNYEAFGALLAPEFLEVEPDGYYDKAGSVKGVSTFDASKSMLSDFKTSNIDANSSLVTYVVKDPGYAPKGERHTTIWVNRGGKWMGLFHHGGTPVEAPPAASTSPAK